MGLDYRVVGVGNAAYKILGVIDFCVREDKRRQGVGASMLKELSDYAEIKDVDFLMLISDDDRYYTRKGFKQIQAPSSWLRINDYKSYGVAFDHLDDLFIKATGDKNWQAGHVDWLGYMF
jgi:predicted N-acetyltransferase YhbS